MVSEDFPYRQSIRLKGFDYTNRGYYFVTICTHGRENLFGTIRNVGARPDAPDMQLNEFGRIVENNVKLMPKWKIFIDKYQIMPNHIHLIMVISGASGQNNISGASGRAPTKLTLGWYVGALKTLSTRQINRISGPLKRKIFQRNYYERIIRNEKELWQARNYIESNVANWKKDKLFN